VSRADLVLAALRDGETFRSAQQLHAQIRDGGGSVGLATVYRRLAALAETGAVDSMRTESGETLYRACRTVAHHHHLSCRRCGRVVELDARAVDRWAVEVAARHGFADVDHVVEIVGTCTGCVAMPSGPDG
jgi:Fur family transcriptional regulator, ferric uptake regulator